MRKKIATLITLAVLAATAPLLSACYTTAGAGKDLSAAGHGITDSADSHTGYRP
jgi:predicted small secreted protein